MPLDVLPKCCHVHDPFPLQRNKYMPKLKNLYTFNSVQQRGSLVQNCLFGLLTVYQLGGIIGLFHRFLVISDYIDKNQILNIHLIYNVEVESSVVQNMTSAGGPEGIKPNSKVPPHHSTTGQHPDCSVRCSYHCHPKPSTTFISKAKVCHVHLVQSN